MLNPEQLARQQIDAMLVVAGWAVQDHGSYNPGAARGIARREVPLTSGRCDYLLIVDRHPLGVIEAKRAGTLLVGVAEQSAHYAVHLPAFFKVSAGELPFAYESTGTETFFRNARDPAPRSRAVFAFHQPETLAAWTAEPDTLRARLQRLPVLDPTRMRDCQIDEEQHAPGLGVLEHAVEGGDGGVGLAAAGGHLNQRARAVGGKAGVEGPERVPGGVCQGAAAGFGGASGSGDHGQPERGGGRADLHSVPRSS
jgi:hypothetical protein